ncbi:MAG TPA: leucine-rich repeat domain-containing protein [Mucilaginibacter sp.]|nr:leucine-rich repeat domain-containing protein [Mucilaginibacter sp.]
MYKISSTLCLLFFSYFNVLAQQKLPEYITKFSAEHPAQKGSFYSIEEANKKPDKVIFLNLSLGRLNEIPKDILRYKNLKSLSLDYNNIKEIPAWFASLNALQDLSLSKNQLTIFPAVLLKLKKLKTINLSSNNIYGFEKLNANFSIEELYINLNNISQIPADLSCFTKLKILDMGNNKLTFLPGVIFNMPQLEYVHLFRNEISDFQVVDNPNSNLKGIYLPFNPISDQSVQKLRRMLPNCYISMSLDKP